jgi:hypothetical protein
MKLLRLAGLSLLAGLIASPALAAGADGKWDCKLDDGSSMGSLGLRGNTYVFANPHGPSGSGALAYQQGSQDPTFVVLNGALLSVGVLGGTLDASIADAPELTVVDGLGHTVDCTPRP